MNMPCLSPPAYHKQVDTILQALETEAKDEMKKEAQRVRNHIFKENRVEANDAVVNAAVSFGGCSCLLWWMQLSPLVDATVSFGGCSCLL